MTLEVEVHNNDAGVSPELQACLVDAIDLIGDILKKITALGNSPTSRGMVQLTINSLDDATGAVMQAIQAPASDFPEWAPPRTN